MNNQYSFFHSHEFCVCMQLSFAKASWLQMDNKLIHVTENFLQNYILQWHQPFKSSNQNLLHSTHLIHLDLITLIFCQVHRLSSSINHIYILSKYYLQHQILKHLQFILNLVLKRCLRPSIYVLHLGYKIKLHDHTYQI